MYHFHTFKQSWSHSFVVHVSLQRLLSERGDAVAKASKETHVVTVTPLFPFIGHLVSVMKTGRCWCDICSPPDGLPFSGPREGPGHLLWDESDPSWHSWLLRKLEGFQFKSLISLFLEFNLKKCFLCRQKCMTSSIRIWIRWPIQKERRSLPCTEWRSGDKFNIQHFSSIPVAFTSS